MGCMVSSEDGGGNRKPVKVGEVAVFVPGVRVPKSIDFSILLVHSMSKSLVERLSALRTRIVVMVAQEAPTAIKPRQRTAKLHGGSTLSDLMQALEEYLPVLLGLAKDGDITNISAVYQLANLLLQYLDSVFGLTGSQIVDKVQFLWVNQVDDTEETIMANAWYEILSVLHLMGILCLSEANFLLLPKAVAQKSNYQPKESEVIEEDQDYGIDIKWDEYVRVWEVKASPLL